MCWILGPGASEWNGAGTPGEPNLGHATGGIVALGADLIRSLRAPYINAANSANGQQHALQARRVIDGPFRWRLLPSCMRGATTKEDAMSDDTKKPDELIVNEGWCLV